MGGWVPLDRFARYYTLKRNPLSNRQRAPHALRKKSQSPLAMARNNLWTALSLMIREDDTERSHTPHSKACLWTNCECREYKH